MRQNLRILAVVAVAVAAAWLTATTLRHTFFDFAHITNESMLPYLKPGEWVLVNKLDTCLKLPLTSLRFFCRPCFPGRAYIFENPLRPGQKLAKFALPAPTERTRPALQRDIIWFTQGAPVAGQSASGSGTCYFEGSNREHSVDSRHFGAVPLEKIDGEIIYPRIRLND